MNAYDLHAVIDVGSSSLTLKIAQLSRGNPPRIIESIRGNLALGIDTYTNHRIRQERITRCCELLSGFAKKLEEYKIRPEDCIVVATSALREAQNREYVKMQIKNETGFDVRVIDNSMERFYHNVAISEALPDFNQIINEGAIILDISSGSIQISVYIEGQCIFSQNLLLGVLRVNELLDDLRERTRDFVSLMNEFVDSEINDFHILEPNVMKYPHIIALAPGVSYLKRLVGLPLEVYKVKRETVDRMFEEVQQKSPSQLTITHGIPGDIADLLLPTSVILHKYMTYNDLDVIEMPQADLSDGILTKLAESRYKYKPRYDHVQDTISIAHHLAARFHYDRPHVTFTEVMSLKVFDILKRRFKLTKRQRLLLQLACILHDIGKFIHMNHHSHRSFNIINYIEMIGISEEEREIVAWVARLHSSVKLPEQDFLNQIRPSIQQDVLRLSSILRMVDGLDASHRQKFISIKPRLQDNELVLKYTTNEDIVLEQASFKGKSELFRSVYGMTPVLKPKGSK